MREPYQTMFEGFTGNWLLGPYLADDLDEPDWNGIAGLGAEIDRLSTGEKVLLDFAAAWKNCACYLDDLTQYRVSLALKQVL